MFSPKGEPTFCATLVGEIAPLYPPSDADFVFSDIRGGHSAPVIWAGFHWRVFLPSTFCHSLCEMAPLYPPSADFVFSDIRGGHSAPVIWAGFHRRVFLPFPFCHSVCDMAPLDSPKRDNKNRFGEFSFSLRLVYGRVFYPGFPSCGRAVPEVEPGTFGLEIRCSTTEPFRPPQDPKAKVFLKCSRRSTFNICLISSRCVHMRKKIRSLSIFYEKQRNVALSSTSQNLGESNTSLFPLNFFLNQPHL